MKPGRIAVCWEEPFRVFFPLGLLFGSIGVLLWPLFFFGASSTWPSTAHARLMVEGMMACFVFGFLGTAGPRLMSVPHFSRGEVLWLEALLSGAATAHLWGWHAAADTSFLLALLLFAASLARRFRQREDSPPPNFALVGLGLLNGIVGAALITFCEWTGSAPTLYRLGNSFLNIGFVLLPILGVAPFFLRKLLDLPTDVAGQTSRGAKLALALATGLVIDASFVLELLSANPLPGWARAATAFGYIALTLPMRGSNLLAGTLRMSLAALPAGLALVALLPAYRIPALHVLFIGGFSVAVFAVATRVVLGHSGRLGLLVRRRWVFVTALGLVLLGMTSRYVADFVATRNSHLAWAGVCWLVGAAIWGALVLPSVLVVEDE